MFDRELIANEQRNYSEEDRQFVRELLIQYKEENANLNAKTNEKYHDIGISFQVLNTERKRLKQELRERLHKRFGEDDIEATLTLCESEDISEVGNFHYKYNLFEHNEFQLHHLKALSGLLTRFISENSDDVNNLFYFIDDFYQVLKDWMEKKGVLIDPELVYQPFNAFIKLFEKQKIVYESLKKTVINFVTLLLKNDWKMTPKVSDFLLQMQAQAKIERQPEINLYLQTVRSVQDGELASKHLPDAQDFRVLDIANTFTTEKLSAPPDLHVHSEEFDFRSVGNLVFTYLTLEEPMILETRNETLNLDVGDKYIEVHFSPFGLNNFDHRNPVHQQLQAKVMTAISIGALQLIEALKDFPFSMNTPVIGWTNPTMADFAEKYLGLKRAKRTNSTQKKYQYVYSTVGEIETKLHDNMQTLLKIVERAQKRTRA